MPEESFLLNIVVATISYLIPTEAHEIPNSSALGWMQNNAIRFTEISSLPFSPYSDSQCQAADLLV